MAQRHCPRAMTGFGGAYFWAVRVVSIPFQVPRMAQMSALGIYRQLEDAYELAGCRRFGANRKLLALRLFRRLSVEA